MWSQTALNFVEECEETSLIDILDLKTLQDIAIRKICKKVRKKFQGSIINAQLGKGSLSPI